MEKTGFTPHEKKKDGGNGRLEKKRYNYEAWDAGVYPQLTPAFPAQRKTLSYDAGFDQTPVLKSIRDHYHAVKPSSADFLSELFREPRHVLTLAQKKNLRAICSIISPSVVSVSSFYGVERKVDCSGLIIDWSSSEKEATIVTSAKLLWNAKEYNADFHLIVRMEDGTLHLAREDHVDYYNNLLTLKLKSRIELKVVDLRCQGDIVERTSVIALGRSFCTHVLCDFPGELYKQYPYFGCEELLRSTCHAPKMCEGGPLITDTGDVLGINFLGNGDLAHLLPTSVILTCLGMWRSFRTVVRPWLGVSTVDSDMLSYQAWTQLKISHQESRVVVREVFDRSVAAENDVRPFDTIATVNGTAIESGNQYSQVLSEASRALTVCGDLDDLLTVVIDPFDRRTGGIIVVADNLSVGDMRFNDCWPKLKADEWSRKNFGSQ
ncbi:hypothetical protein OROGR_001773 [Orobanche gracilis]